MKHTYYVYRTVAYTERVKVYAENRYMAELEALSVVNADWDSDNIDRDLAFESEWVAQLDEEELVEDLLNTPDSKCLDDVVETMFDEEVKG